MVHCHYHFNFLYNIFISNYCQIIGEIKAMSIDFFYI